MARLAPVIDGSVIRCACTSARLQNLVMVANGTYRNSILREQVNDFFFTYWAIQRKFDKAIRLAKAVNAALKLNYFDWKSYMQLWYFSDYSAV